MIRSITKSLLHARDLGFRSFETRYGRIGVLICWINGSPSCAPDRAQRAQIIFYPTPSVGIGERAHTVKRGMQPGKRSTQPRIANGVFTLPWPNRIGHEGETAALISGAKVL